LSVSRKVVLVMRQTGRSGWRLSLALCSEYQRYQTVKRLARPLLSWLRRTPVVGRL